MDDYSRQSADERAVDADELQVAADRIFDAVGYGGCVPIGDGVGDQRYDIVAVILGCADNRSAGKAVNLALELVIILQARAELNERLAEFGCCQMNQKSPACHQQ